VKKDTAKNGVARSKKAASPKCNRFLVFELGDFLRYRATILTCLNFNRSRRLSKALAIEK